MCENILEETKCYDDDILFCFVFVFINDALGRLIKEKNKGEKDPRFALKQNLLYRKW